MSVVERIRGVLAGETDREQSEPNVPMETHLYRCDPCGTTYVSDDMESCSQCNAAVERIPSERDLGLV